MATEYEEAQKSLAEDVAAAMDQAAAFERAYAAARDRRDESQKASDAKKAEIGKILGDNQRRKVFVLKDGRVLSAELVGHRELSPGGPAVRVTLEEPVGR